MLKRVKKRQILVLILLSMLILLISSCSSCKEPDPAVSDTEIFDPAVSDAEIYEYFTSGSDNRVPNDGFVYAPVAKRQLGNSVANITAFGPMDGYEGDCFIASEGDWIYYCGNEGLCKISAEVGATPILIVRYDLFEYPRFGWVFGVLGDWIYMADNLYFISRIRTDGKYPQIVTKYDTFASNGYIGWPTVVGNSIYYLQYDTENKTNTLYNIRVDGQNRRALLSGPFSRLTYVPSESYEQSIYFNNTTFNVDYGEADDGIDIMLASHWGGYVGSGSDRREDWFLSRVCVDRSFATVYDGYFYQVMRKLDEEFSYVINRFKQDGSGGVEKVFEIDGRYHMIDNGILYCNKNGCFSAVDLKTKKVSKICDDFANRINIANGWLFYTALDTESEDRIFSTYRIHPDGTNKEFIEKGRW